MHITDEQRSRLNAFKCIRLSADDKLLRTVEDFKNPRNDNLVDYLQGDAAYDDAAGRTACYVVLDEDREVLAYFTLKSGLLYSEYEELRLYEQHKKLKRHLLELSEGKKTEESQALIQDISKKLKESKDRIIKKLGSFDYLPLHKQVATSYPAIELSHFCVNDLYRKKWNAMGFGNRNRIGLTVFWKFIIKKVMEISQLIGTQYMYLFAADATADRFLVNHYINFMGFRDDMDVLAIQPIYDFKCTFLCNTIDSLTEGRQDFFNTFNDEEDLS